MAAISRMVKTMLTTINASALSKPAGHYSHAAIHGDTVYVSGLLPFAADGSIDATLTFAAQAERVLDHLEATLASAGSNLSSLVKVTVYVADITNWPRFNEIYAARLGSHRPARAVVPVPELHYGFALEIDAIAAIAAIAAKANS
jgi:2-iminobutanoate/2-iminopropanoate deaminase